MILSTVDELKPYIYGHFDEVELMATFFQVSAEDINDCLANRHKKIRNVLRDDKNASLSFTYVYDKAVKVKIRAKDWANSRYTGDLIHITGVCFNINSNSKKGFVEVCNKIIDIATGNERFNLVQKDIIINIKEVGIIKPYTREFNKLDEQYWNQFDLNIDDLKEGLVSAVESAQVYSDVINYNYTTHDPCYCYTLDNFKGEQRYELMFPFRKKCSSQVRYITNSDLPLKCMFELVPADVLIITKSRKDVLAMRKQLKKFLTKVTSMNNDANRDEVNESSEISNPSFFLWGDERSELSTSQVTLSINKDHLSNATGIIPRVCITCFHSETIVLTEKLANKLAHEYPIIITITDFDNQGIRCAYTHKSLYGFIPLFLTNGKYNTFDYKAKDFTDLIKHNPTEVDNVIIKTLNFINELWNDYNERTEIFN